MLFLNYVASFVYENLFLRTPCNFIDWFRLNHVIHSYTTKSNTNVIMNNLLEVDRVLRTLGNLGISWGKNEHIGNLRISWDFFLFLMKNFLCIFVVSQKFLCLIQKFLSRNLFYPTSHKSLTANKIDLL